MMRNANFKMPAQQAARPTQAQIRKNDPLRNGRTTGTYRDRSLLSGPMYRGQGQARTLGGT